MIRIGTSGWHYKHWLGNFYPEKLRSADMLSHYVREFDTVEINNSFYRLPETSSFESWRRSTPADFLFAVKGSRYISHMKKLSDPAPSIEKFFPRVEALGDKLGPILFQLPPRWRVNAERLRSFLALLPTEHRYAFEFREQSWLTSEIYQILEDYNAAFCIYQIAGYHSPLEITADWSYVRLHGPTAFAYQGSYDATALRKWATWMERQSAKLRSIFLYFDNDDAGYAAANAMELKRMMEGRSRRRSARAADAELPAPIRAGS